MLCDILSIACYQTMAFCNVVLIFFCFRLCHRKIALAMQLAVAQQWCMGRPCLFAVTSLFFKSLTGLPGIKSVCPDFHLYFRV